MIVVFTEAEMEHINTKRFRWTVKDDCPESMRKRIERKLGYLYDKEYDQSNPIRNKMPKEEANIHLNTKK